VGACDGPTGHGGRPATEVGFTFTRYEYSRCASRLQLTAATITAPGVVHALRCSRCMVRMLHQVRELVAVVLSCDTL